MIWEKIDWSSLSLGIRAYLRRVYEGFGVLFTAWKERGTPGPKYAVPAYNIVA